MRLQLLPRAILDYFASLVPARSRSEGLTCERISALTIPTRLKSIYGEQSPEHCTADILISGTRAIRGDWRAEMATDNELAGLTIEEIDIGDTTRSFGPAEQHILITVLNSASLSIVTGIVANCLTSRFQTNRNKPPMSVVIEGENELGKFKICCDGSPATIRALKQIANTKELRRWLK